MEQLLEILEDIDPTVDYRTETDLVGDGILNSLSIMTLVVEIRDAFDVDITPQDILPENFRSAQAIYALIQRRQSEE
ncbi:MAG: acyl carrier protein [Clostridiales bacterium]|jgi:acyl carrier protein|nr:acyl carrier protein [Clostridiales bacterium]